jgi:LemA protein
MKKNGKAIVIVPIVILLVLLAVGGWVAGTYNSLVVKDTETDNQWANVQTQYQRRADLIPNLVSTVQGAVDFEQETQTQIAALRTQAVQVKADIGAAQTPAELQAAVEKLDGQDGIVSRFNGLNINVENYPQLRAVENFLSLQDELAGTENRVQIARENFNEAVKSYNVGVRRFPANILAGMFGFDQKDFFEATPGSEDAPTVAFN